MDLNLADVLMYRGDARISDCQKDDHFNDVPPLGLDYFGHETNKTADAGHSGNKEPPALVDDDDDDDGCTLFLGLGPAPSFHGNNKSDAVGIAREASAEFSHCLDSGMLRLGFPRGSVEMEPATVSLEPGHVSPASVQSRLQQHQPERSPSTSVIDEGSTSARRSFGGYMPSLLLAPRPEEYDGGNGNARLQFSPEPSATTDCSMSVDVASDPRTGGTAFDSRSDHHQQHRNHHQPKKCRFEGCFKGARGASGLCIAHGGGQRCQRPGCNRGAESRTPFCKAHGGGRRCQELGCTKAAEGKTDFCIAHGGGRRCAHEGCTKAARGRSGRCIRHGGGKRCRMEGCTRSAEGQVGLCISHGGGRRCQYLGCKKGAQGSTLHCKAHGGGKRCVFEGCTKGAEGSTPLCKGHGGGKRCLYNGGGVCPKSVHGGTDYCVAHGGGKRCAVAGCTKSARGRTDCCVRHGGGKRCMSAGCGKSAQGSTDFCKAHGGGKRCGWAQGCEKFARGRSGLCAAHATMAAAYGKKGSTITTSRGVVVSAASTSGVDRDHHNNNNYNNNVTSSVTASTESYTTRMVVPPQVLVPTPMGLFVPGEDEEDGKRTTSSRLAVPEGRVHGGGLLSLLGGNLYNVDVDVGDISL